MRSECIHTEEAAAPAQAGDHKPLIHERSFEMVAATTGPKTAPPASASTAVPSPPIAPQATKVAPSPWTFAMAHGVALCRL